MDEIGFIANLSGPTGRKQSCDPKSRHDGHEEAPAEIDPEGSSGSFVHRRMILGSALHPRDRRSAAGGIVGRLDDEDAPPSPTRICREAAPARPQVPGVGWT